jgi:hypothetical protein
MQRSSCLLGRTALRVVRPVAESFVLLTSGSDPLQGAGGFVSGLRSSKMNPITCSGAASAGVLLVRAHLLVAYFF